MHCRPADLGAYPLPGRTQLGGLEHQPAANFLVVLGAPRSARQHEQVAVRRTKKIEADVGSIGMPLIL